MKILNFFFRPILLFTLYFSYCAMSIGAEAVDVSGRDGVQQRFLWIKNDNAVASVILFPGGNGKIEISSSGSIDKDTNFLVRTRKEFASHQLNVAVMDAPSDRLEKNNGMMGGFRNSNKHAKDIAAVVAYIKKQSSAPVWLVGTSRGTESAANGGVHLANDIAGIILTSSVSEPNKKGVSLPEMELDKIIVPTLIVSHQDDKCRVTPPEGAEQIKKGLTKAPKVEVKFFSGGDKPQSDPCKPKSAHGFLGIENEVVKYIADFIKTNSK